MIIFGLKQQPEINSPEDEWPTCDLTVRPIDKLVKQASDPILRRVEELCALLTGRTELDAAGKSETSSSRRKKKPKSNHAGQSHNIWPRTTRAQRRWARLDAFNECDTQCHQNHTEEHPQAYIAPDTNFDYQKTKRTLQRVRTPPCQPYNTLLKKPPMKRSSNSSEAYSEKMPFTSGKPSGWLLTPQSMRSCRWSAKRTLEMIPRKYQDTDGTS